MKELAKALANAQGEISGVKKNALNPYFKSSYANLSSAFEAIREPFSKNGLCVSQIMDILEGQNYLITKLLHESGEFLESKMMIPFLPDPQKYGSIITYYRRFALMSICGLAASDDDDGESARKETSKTKNISKTQANAIEKQINGDNVLMGSMLDHENISSIEELRSDRLADVLREIAIYKANQNKRVL